MNDGPIERRTFGLNRRSTPAELRAIHVSSLPDRAVAIQHRLPESGHSAFLPTADIDHSPHTRQLADMNRRIVLIILLALIVGMAADWAGRGLVANDRCLDRGGAWDGRSDSCSLSATNAR